MDKELLKVRKAAARAATPHRPSAVTAAVAPRAQQAGLRLAAGGRPLGPDHVLGLQQTVGNQAVQRLLATGRDRNQPASARQIQRKMSWKNTQWASAQYLDASSGGGGGVLFVGEAGRELVLKPGEEMATEGAMAALLHNTVGKTGKNKGLTLAPGLRSVAPDEAQQAKAALLPLVDSVGATTPDVKGSKGRKFKNDRAKGLMALLDKPGVVVQDLASGKEMKDALGEKTKKHTEKKLLGGRKLRKDSPLRIFTDSRSIEALGKTTAVDLFVGNKDRMFMYNPENFFVTPYSLSMIDNIWMGTDMSYFQTAQVEGRGGKMFTITRDEGLATWKQDGDVKNLAAGNYDAVSTRVFDSVVQNAAASTRAVDAGAFAGIMNSHRASFIKSFNKGLAQGKQTLITSLTALQKDRSKLQKLVPGVNLDEVMDTIGKRKNFLSGGGN